MDGLDWVFDFGQFAPACLRIVDKQGQLVPFVPTAIQQAFYRELGDGVDKRLVVVKARQAKISSAIVAWVMHHWTTTLNYRAMTMAHDADTTGALFDVAKTMHAEMPSGPKLERNNAKHLKSVGINSSYRVQTAGNRKAGRGQPMKFLHLSEYAFYADDRVFTGASQMVPKGGAIVIESTANGFNHFYKRVKAIRSGGMPGWKLVFFPWWLEPEYRGDVAVPEREWTDAERVAAEKAAATGVTLDGYQVAWRRAKWDELTGDSGVSAFPQEYAEDLQTCFLASGTPRFAVGHLNELLPAVEAMQPVVEQTIEGTAMVLREWEAPVDGKHYVIGADSAEGLSAGDANNACVIEWESGRKVADLWGRSELYQYGEELVKLGRRWNDALLAIEKNNMGIVVVKEAQRLGYGHLYHMIHDNGEPDDDAGWRTDAVSRPIMIDTLARFYTSASAVQVRDVDEIGEAMSFVIGARGKAQAEAGAHDDKVMGRGIALMARQAFTPRVTQASGLGRRVRGR